jgi:hypothetical protein
MTSGAATAGRVPGRPAIGFFERWLTLWVFLCIVAGIALGQIFPAPFQALGRMEIARVNIPVGLLIWVMIIPMLLKIDFGAIGQVRQHVRGIGVTLAVNWLVKPFSMALLACSSRPTRPLPSWSRRRTPPAPAMPTAWVAWAEWAAWIWTCNCAYAQFMSVGR